MFLMFGFEGPLALITFPLAILFVLLLGYKQARHMDYEKLKPALEKQDAIRKQYGVRIYIPLLVLVALMVIFKVLKLGEDIGMPLMFLISAAVGLFNRKKIQCTDCCTGSHPYRSTCYGYSDGCWYVHRSNDSDRRSRSGSYQLSASSEHIVALSLRDQYSAVWCSFLLRRMLGFRRSVRLHLCFTFRRKFRCGLSCYQPDRCCG